MDNKKLKNIILLMRLDKPIGILLLAWPTLWALWLSGNGRPPLRIVSIFILGVVIMRSAGCVINDIIDRQFDPHVDRTKRRVLATGELTIREAWLVWFILMGLAFCLIEALDPLTQFYACIGALLAIFYPFLKRVIPIPQLGLGAAFAWGVPMSFTALQQMVPQTGWLLFTGVLLWIVSYDTLYAMVDRKDDIKINIKSTAVFFNRYDRLMIAILQASFLLLLMIEGKLYHLSFFYYISLLIAFLLFAHQHFLIKNRQPAACFQAFINNQWVGFIIFLGLFFSYR